MLAPHFAAQPSVARPTCAVVERHSPSELLRQGRRDQFRVNGAFAGFGEVLARCAGELDRAGEGRGVPRPSFLPNRMPDFQGDEIAGRWQNFA